MSNYLDFGKLDYSELLTQIREKLSSENSLQNFKESSNSTMILENFAAMTSLLSYYIQRASEESFLETAKLKSSLITRAKELGYIVTRPIPAQTTLSMKISGALPSGLTAGVQLILPKKTKFSYNGSPYLLKNSYAYTFTNDDITNGVGNNDFEKIISFVLISDSGNIDLIESDSNISPDSLTGIDLIQGEILEYTINGVDNPLVGQKFQKYVIDNTLKFSNLYGEEDLGYNFETGEYDFYEDLTRVAIDTTNPFDKERNFEVVDYTKFYKISRKGLLVNNRTTSFDNPDNICTIKTSDSGGVQVEFGDGISAKIGASNSNQNIYISYLSTEGVVSNEVGVIGSLLSTDETFIAGSYNLTNNLEFTLNSNIIYGSDIESNDSIRLNAPAVYQSFDRLITKLDFESYLKSLTYPIDIVNAVVWGEQEELENNNNLSNGEPVFGIQKLFNVILYSCLAELYQTNTSPYYPISDNTSAVLDENYSGVEVTKNHYFNILVKESVIPSLINNRDNPNSKIAIVTKKLDPKIMITNKVVYVSPFIKDFSLSGIVYIKKLANKVLTERLVNDSIYSYLNNDIDFGKPIYVSKLIELIESNPNVEYCDAYVEPTSADFSGLNSFGYTYSPTATAANINDVTIDNNSILSADTVTRDAVKDVYIDTINKYFFNSDQLIIQTSATEISNTKVFSTYKVFNYENVYMNSVTERYFWNVFAKNLYDSVYSASQSFAESNDFIASLAKIRTSMDIPIKRSMMDLKGNISNFSILNEISKITSNLLFLYK